nr:MAG TPA: hypothetical protein [Caudoviricetes sp.]
MTGLTQHCMYNLVICPIERGTITYVVEGS